MTDQGIDTSAWNSSLRAASAAGNPLLLAAIQEPMAHTLVGAVDIQIDERVLDLGAGVGNVAIAAAKAGGAVTAVESSPELAEIGKQRCAAAGVNVEWVVADLAHTGLRDWTYDVVLSNFGVIWTASGAKTTGEMMRVMSPSGRAAFTAWPEDSFNGRVNAIVAPLLPAGVGDVLASQHDWAELDFVHGWFTSRTVHMDRLTDRSQKFDSVEAWWEANQDIPAFAWLRSTLSADAYEDFKAKVLQACTETSDTDSLGKITRRLDYSLAVIR